MPDHNVSVLQQINVTLSLSREAADDQGDWQSNAEHDRQQADGGADGGDGTPRHKRKRQHHEVHECVDSDAVEQSIHHRAFNQEKPLPTREIKDHGPYRGD